MTRVLMFVLALAMGPATYFTCRALERRRCARELRRWSATGIRRIYTGHDERTAVSSAERAARHEKSRRKLHALRARPSHADSNVVSMKERTGR